MDVHSEKMWTQNTTFCTSINIVLLRYTNWRIEDMAGHLNRSPFLQCNVIYLNTITIVNFQNCNICVSNKMSAIHKTNCILIYSDALYISKWLMWNIIMWQGLLHQKTWAQGKFFSDLSHPKVERPHIPPCPKKTTENWKMKLHFREKKYREDDIFLALNLHHGHLRRLTKIWKVRAFFLRQAATWQHSAK